MVGAGAAAAVAAVAVEGARPTAIEAVATGVERMRMAVVYRAISTVAVEAAARHRDVMVGETTESVRETETETETEIESARAIVVAIGTAIGAAIGTAIESAESVTADEKGNGLVEAARQTLD